MLKTGQKNNMGGGNNNKFCEKTLSQKHFWEEVNSSWEIIEDGIRPATYYKKCRACGMVDDKMRFYKK